MLLIKNGNWEQKEITDVTNKISSFGYVPLLLPNKVENDFKFFERLISSNNPLKVLDEITTETGLSFHSTSDNLPFILTIFAWRPM